MVDEKGKIAIRSDQVDDILGKEPGWLTHYGMIIFLVIILMLISGAWIFKIPDVKKAKITLTSVRPPATIAARSSGKIENLFVKDNAVVNAGDILAEVENAAILTDVLNLKQKLRKLELSLDGNDMENLIFDNDLRLGNIQSIYAAFKKDFREYVQFVALNYHQRKIELLVNEHDLYKNNAGKLDLRASILNEEYELVARQYARDSLLFEQGVVSESDFENSKSLMLQKRNNWQEVLSLKSENDILISGIKDGMLELELNRQEEQIQKFTKLEESYNTLMASIDQWEKNYLIIAPISGHVTFTSIWSENQNVEVGENVMTIIPEDAGDLLGKIQLPIKGAGEVEIGQQVNIRFENYPYLEYGMVRGKVSNVSQVPQNNFYTVEVQFPEGLVTYYGQKVDFNQNMQGDVEIITDDMRLLQRVFNPVRSAISRQKELQ